MPVKYIIIIVLFNASIVACSHDTDIKVEIHDIEVTESSFSFRYTVKNDYGIPVWLHTSIGISKLDVIGNTIFYVPVAYDLENVMLAHSIPVKTARIKPGRSFSGCFSCNARKDQNFLYAEYIDLTLVFTTSEVPERVFIPQYNRILSENKIIVNKRFRIQE